MGAALRLIRLALAAIAILCGLPALADAPPPARLDRVMDGANILDASAVRQLRELSARLEQRTGAQLVVMSVPTLAGQDISAYASSLLTRWRLGQPGRNNGIVVLLAPLQGQARIEVGSDLGMILTSGDNAQLIAGTLLPAFRANRHGEGTVAAVQTLTAKVEAFRGTPAPTAVLPPPARERSEFDKVLPWIVLVVVIVLAVVFLRAMLCSSGRHYGYGYSSYDRHHHHYHNEGSGYGLARSVISGIFRAGGGRFDGGGASGSW